MKLSHIGIYIISYLRVLYKSWLGYVQYLNVRIKKGYKTYINGLLWEVRSEANYRIEWGKEGNKLSDKPTAWKYQKEILRYNKISDKAEDLFKETIAEHWANKEAKDSIAAKRMVENYAKTHRFQKYEIKGA